MYQLDPKLWTDICTIDVGFYGIVGFKTDGSVIVAEPPQMLLDSGSASAAENWDNVVAISGYYRLKSDGTVDAPEDAVDYDRSFSGVADTNIPRFPAKDVSGLTDIKVIYAYSGDSGLYSIKNDNSVIYVGDSYNGAANVSEYTNIVEIYEGYIGLRADGTLAIAEAHGSDAEKWTDIRIPEVRK